MFTLEFCAEVNHDETSLWLSYSEDPHDRSMSHIDTVPACYGQTDGQMDTQTNGFTMASTALCIAGYADAL